MKGKGMTGRTYRNIGWILLWSALILGNLAALWAMARDGDTLPALLGVECAFLLVAAVLFGVIADNR